MNKDVLKKCFPYLVALLVFILFAVIYCSPVLEGKIVQAGDTVSWKGMYQEGKVNNDKGNYSFWTGSMFSGMPTYQIGGGKIESGIYLNLLNKIINLWFKGVLQILILYLLGFAPPA
jgi:hypothetical protein